MNNNLTVIKENKIQLLILRNSGVREALGKTFSRQLFIFHRNRENPVVQLFPNEIKSKISTNEL